jgi:hypothetical protein
MVSSGTIRARGTRTSPRAAAELCPLPKHRYLCHARITLTAAESVSPSPYTSSGRQPQGLHTQHGVAAQKPKAARLPLRDKD